MKTTPSAMSLHANAKISKTNMCVFCEKDHVSAKCEKARKLSLSERKSVLQTKKTCFNYLKIGHLSRACRGNMKCALCDRRYVVLMCPENKSEDNVAPSLKKEEESVKEKKMLLNRIKGPEVILQTLCTRVRSYRDEQIVRVFLDTGSSWSYVSKDLVRAMQYEPIAVNLKHSLFENVSTEIKKHKYLIHLSSLDRNYSCNFKIYDEDEICADIPLWEEQPWMDELKELNILLTDRPEESIHKQPIKILIEADIAGKLMTGKTKQLKCGLTAIETHLGWIIMGEIPSSRGDGLATRTIFMMQQETCISDLWSLDILGIKDPVTEKSRKDHDEEVLQHFVETIITNEEGRDETALGGDAPRFTA